LLLKDCLWNHQDNAEDVAKIIKNVLENNSYSVPNDETSEADNEAPVTSGAELNKIIKGLKGSGTELDPFLIENHHNLFNLAQPKVGLKGYHFKQTTDIDCSDLDTWMEINFKGDYNGNGKFIKFKGSTEFEKVIGKKVVALFNHIEPESKVTSLYLEKLHLANTIEGSDISNCSSDLVLIGDSARKTSITQSKASPLLIKNNAENCKIHDCIVITEIKSNYEGHLENLGLIASVVSQKSEILRCYIAGEVENKSGYYFQISGITGLCENSKISDCAVGLFKFSVSHVELKNRILSSYNDAAVIENNVSIDSNSINNKDDVLNGVTVRAPLFEQYYFEHALGWDFDSVWEWDNENSQPKLRMEPVLPTSNGVKSVDVLTQQISANIWL